MKLFFDTSVLVPVFLEAHEHHDASLEAFLASAKKQGFCSAHSLAEFYATVTRLPGKHRLSGEQVLLLLGEIRERLTLVSLSGEETFAALQDGAASGIVGGTIYDALIARCARKVAADVIYSWNVRHFAQFGSDIASRLKTP